MFTLRQTTSKMCPGSLELDHVFKRWLREKGLKVEFDMGLYCLTSEDLVSLGLS